MKILSVTWSVQDNEVPELRGVLTGAGIVIHNICEYIGKQHTSYLLIGQLPMRNRKVGNIHYVNNGLTKECCADNGRRLKRVIEAFAEALDNVCPDFVNLHGEGDFICACVKICKERNIPFVVTIHLYVGKNQKIAGYEKAKEYWENLLQIPDVNYIVVGNGLKQKIQNDYPDITDNRVRVIENGTNYKADYRKNSIKKELGLENKKVLILAGTINARKNQEQVVRAYKLLPQKVQEKLGIVFCGMDMTGGRFEKMIQEENLSEYLKYVGSVPAVEMGDYYYASDGYVMPSLAEGLSISQLEALRFGLPLIMFRDSECAYDLNDSKICVLAEERTDEMLAKAIVLWFEKTWDRQYIREYSQTFTMENTAEKYIRYYEEFYRRK